MSNNKVIRRVEMTMVRTGTNEAANFWVEVRVEPDASDKTISKFARRMALAHLHEAHIEASQVEVSYIEPRFESLL